MAQASIKKPRFSFLRVAQRLPELTVILAIIIVIIGFLIFAPTTFLSARNVGAFMTAAAQLGAVAIGAAVLMIAGEFDLSLGSNFTFSGISIGLLATVMPVWLAIIIGLAIATAIGLINGIITLWARIPSFITTLGSWLVWLGLSLAISGGFFVSAPNSTSILRVFGGPLGKQFYASILWWVAIGIVVIVLLSRTPFGNWIFAVGGKTEAARASGVPVARVKLFAFAFAGFTAGVAAIFLLGQQGSMGAIYGQNMALQAIAASVIGGCSLFGGVGTVFGAMLGATMMSMLNSGLVLAGAPTFWYETFVGAIIVAAVVINTVSSRKLLQMRR
jgi:simple sugar transport system permease protein